MEAQLGAGLLALRRRAAVQRAAAARSLGRLAPQRPGERPASHAPDDSDRQLGLQLFVRSVQATEVGKTTALQMLPQSAIELQGEACAWNPEV